MDILKWCVTEQHWQILIYGLKICCGRFQIVGLITDVDTINLCLSELSRTLTTDVCHRAALDSVNISVP